MKKWIFVIAPACMMGLFVLFYLQETHRLDALQAQRDEAAAHQKAEDDAKKHTLQENARRDSERRAAEQAAEAAKREADRTALRLAENKKIADATEAANTEIAEYAAKIKALQDKLDALQKKKEQESRDGFELMKEVERARVAQETADLESQRMVEMIANRASQAAMATFTPPPSK